MRSLPYYIQFTHQNIMYHIVNISPEYDYDDRNGNYEIIQTFASYDDADAKFDEWSERLPHAFLEIVSV